MNGKKAKQIRRLAKQAADREGLEFTKPLQRFYKKKYMEAKRNGAA